MSYVFSILIIAVLCFVVVKNIIAIVQKIKERKQAKKDSEVVEITTDKTIEK